MSVSRWHARKVGLAIAAFVAASGTLVGAGCNKIESRSGVGQPCSTSSDNNPHYICDPRFDLLCIATTVDKKTYCRAPCPGKCEAGEVCCPGTIHGNASFGGTTYQRGCTPRSRCDIIGDSGGDFSGGSDASSDGSGSDGLLGN